MEAGAGYRETKAVVQQTTTTPGIAVASAGTPAVARQGEAVSAGLRDGLNQGGRPGPAGLRAWHQPAFPWARIASTSCP